MILLDLVAGDVGENRGRPGLDLLALRYGHRLQAVGQRTVLQAAKHAAGSIGVQLAQIPVHLKRAVELAGGSLFQIGRAHV